VREIALESAGRSLPPLSRRGAMGEKPPNVVAASAGEMVAFLRARARVGTNVRQSALFLPLPSVGNEAQRELSLLLWRPASHPTHVL
jgi:hypothetical protein